VAAAVGSFVFQALALHSGPMSVVQPLLVARDADLIETLLQATEFQAQGHDTMAWRETSAAALQTSSARQLAQTIGSSDPHGWWSAFAGSYSE
jgi:hypothetical protein